jgi:DNA-binding NarL/FixJ family response regulator
VLTSKTVEAHVSSIFLKFGLADDGTANRRVLAVITFLRESLRVR